MRKTTFAAIQRLIWERRFVMVKISETLFACLLSVLLMYDDVIKENVRPFVNNFY